MYQLEDLRDQPQWLRETTNETSTNNRRKRLCDMDWFKYLEVVRERRLWTRETLAYKSGVQSKLLLSSMSTHRSSKHLGAIWMLSTNTLDAKVCESNNNFRDSSGKKAFYMLTFFSSEKLFVRLSLPQRHRRVKRS